MKTNDMIGKGDECKGYVQFSVNSFRVKDRNVNKGEHVKGSIQFSLLKVLHKGGWGI